MKILSIFFCLFALALTARGADRFLYATPISNLVEVVTVLSVANDGTNIVQVRVTNWLSAIQVRAMTQTLHAAISPVISYSLHNTNPVITLDSNTNATGSPSYYGLKIKNLSNDFSYVSFFDSIGSNSYSFRALSQGTNGFFDLFDHFNTATVTRYNGADFRFYRMLAADYVTGDTVAIWNSDKRATNSVVTVSELGNLAGSTEAIQPAIAELRSGGIRPASFILGTNYTAATNVATLFIDATLSNIVVNLPTNTALLDGQTWNIRVVKGTNLVDIRPLRPGTDLIGFGTNLTLAYGEGVSITKIDTNFLSATTSSGGPIGSITAWHKTYGGSGKLSSLWAECNGQVIADLGSPLNGKTIPNLNNSGGFLKKRFLLGNTASGAIWDGDTHIHDLSGFTDGPSADVTVDADLLGVTVQVASDNHTHDVGTATADATAHYPPYFEVVWIMRVK